MRCLSSCAIIMLLLIGIVDAQPPGNTEIRLKTSAIVGGWVKGDTLFIKSDGAVKLPMEYVNRDINSYGGRNKFAVFSPDGATWAHATAQGGNLHLNTDGPGIWVDTTGFYPKDDFDDVYLFDAHGADGTGEDTLRFTGFPYLFEGYHPHDSGVFFYIIVRAKLSDTGKHICVDQLYTNSSEGPWWSRGYLPSFVTMPMWRGPWCFTLAYSCCQGLTGNYDCDPEDRCDISDIAAFVDRYTTLAMPCCPGEANIDGSADGLSDISDLTALIDYLYISFTPPKPCQ